MWICLYVNLFLEFCTPVWLDQYVFVSSKKTGMFVYVTVHLSVYLLERLFVSEYLYFLDMRVCVQCVHSPART